MTKEQKQNKGSLYLIPSTIADISADRVLPERIKEVIGQLDLFLAENIKSARRFISSLNIGKEIDQIRFESMDKRTTDDDILNAMQPLFFGTDIGIISEAGCPGIADPGALAVKIAHENNVKVIPIVGPSSVFLALMASGLNGQSFAFHGYLPIPKNLRNKELKNLERTAQKTNQTQIFIETPYRNNQLLNDILKSCHPNTQLCIAKNITANDEWIKTKPVEYWRKNKPDLHKVPVVFLMNVL